MVRSVRTVAHRGLRDWIWQRLSALIILIYVFGLVCFMLMHHGISFAEWHALFSRSTVKVATILCLSALMIHAWIGMWTIFTDYVKSVFLRAILHAVVISFLFSSFCWGVLIVWSV